MIASGAAGCGYFPLLHVLCQGLHLTAALCLRIVALVLVVPITKRSGCHTNTSAQCLCVDDGLGLMDETHPKCGYHYFEKQGMVVLG